MTPAQAATALLNVMPEPVSTAQLEEYGIEVPDSAAGQIAREILSLNLYWMLAAIDARIPLRYRAAIRETLFGLIKQRWWESGRIGPWNWEEYQRELQERCSGYGRLVDQEGLSHMAVSAATASLIEDQGAVPSEDRQKLLVLLIDYAPAAQYGQLLEEME